ncbi:hypothetical protein D3C83_197100 [compost metagenome]
MAARFPEPPKGEVTLVIGPSSSADGVADPEGALAAVAELVAAGTPRRVAATVVAELTGVPRNALYRRSL